MNLKADLGSNLRHWRRAKRLTQAELAEAADLAPHTISMIERGEAAPSFPAIERLAAALGVAPLVLFGADGDAWPPGERGRLLRKLNGQLSRLNNEQLARVSAIIKAMTR